ncbi:MAG: nucleotidyltransferase family protein [Pseudonocardia sp.]
MATPGEGLARLRHAAETGELDAVCARHGVRILTVFGSAARGEPGARDLDVGVLFKPGTTVDYPAIIDDLVTMTGADVDLVNLSAGGALIRERALVGSVGLFENDPGALSRAATAAALERMDTDWMRRLGLELLAGR